jgi:opacity protein-like surface antigen
MWKNNIHLKECVAAALLLILPALSFGESLGVGNKVLSIGPRVTYAAPKDADTGAWSVGVQARMHLSLGLGLEGSIDNRSNNFSKLTTITTYPVQVSLLAYLFPGAILSPYLIGGVGWYYTQVYGPFSLNHTDSRFGLHAGAGLEYVLSKSLSLDVSYRYIWLGSVASENSNALENTYEDSGSMLAIALNILF